MQRGLVHHDTTLKVSNVTMLLCTRCAKVCQNRVESLVERDFTTYSLPSRRSAWGSAQRWLISISGAMASKLSGKGGFKLRGVVKPLVFFYTEQ